MAHWDDARIAIESRINSNWTTTPVRYWSSGVPFDVPSSAHIAVQIEEFSASQITLGDTPQTHRYFGVLTIQVFVPERQGAKAAAGYCDTLDDLFRRAQFSSGNSGVITCRTPQARTIGVKNGWYQVNLIIEFHRDKQH